MTRRGVALVLVVVALVSVTVLQTVRIGRVTARVERLLLLENMRCNNVRSTLETIQRAGRDGRRELAGNLYAYVERELLYCARDREAVRHAGGDISKLLAAIPERRLDDPELADRDDARE